MASQPFRRRRHVEIVAKELGGDAIGNLDQRAVETRMGVQGERGLRRAAVGRGDVAVGDRLHAEVEEIDQARARAGATAGRAEGAGGGVGVHAAPTERPRHHSMVS